MKYLSALFVLCGVPAQGATRAWIFETKLTGAFNQRLGVAERTVDRIDVFALDDPELRRPQDPRAFVRKTLGLSRFRSDAWPDLIVHTEPWSHETDFLFGLRDLAPKPIRVVHLEDPTHRRDEFDLVVAARHHAGRPGANVLRTTGVATRVTLDRVAEEGARWRERLDWLPRPVIVVGVGGAMDFLPYLDEWAGDLGQRLTRLTKITGGSLVIAASRRTPPSALARLGFELRGVPFLIYDQRRDGDDNPYLAALSLAERVVVTGDSLSMMSDALALGKPLFVHAPAWSLESVHARFTEDVYVRGLARPFVGDERVARPVAPVDAAADIAAELRRRFCTFRLSF